jgi:alpha-1,6-mannosyl-glycoprotein beta-1,2-N-acetylglucosaminyltransferase
VHNLQEFGLSLGPESVVIVVQVHDRANYLKILLDSLRKVKGIEKTLLIISHDVFSQEQTSTFE